MPDQLQLFAADTPPTRSVVQGMLDSIPARERVRPEEAANILQCSVQHVYNLIQVGELDGRNIALDLTTRPMYRVTTSSIRRFLDKRMEGAR